MRTTNAQIAALLAASILTSPLVAGPNHWTSRGPGGGAITALVVDPTNRTIMYAGARDGVARSVDGGETWKSVNHGLSDPVISALYVRRNHPVTVFAGTAAGRLFRTTDGGARWTAVAAFSQGVLAIATIGERGVYVLLDARRLARSEDDGATWEELEHSPNAAQLIAAGEKLFAVSRNESLALVSTDRGSTWSALNAGGMNVRLIANDDYDPRVIIIASLNSVAVSVDGGSTLQMLKALPFAEDSNFRTLSLTAFGGGWYHYGGGVAVTTTRGVFVIDADDFYPVIQLGETANLSTIVAGDTRTRLVAVRSDKLSLSAWNGSQWASRHTGTRTASTFDIAATGSTVYAATFQGLATTADETSAWRPSPVSSSTSSITLTVAATPDAIVAGTMTGVHRSSDGGQTWTMVTPSAERATHIRVSRSNPKTMYAALASAMSKSTDGGQTWFSTQTDMPLSYYYGFYVGAIAVDPKDADTVYVCYDGVYKTTDGGARWRQIIGRYWKALAIDAFDTSLIYGSQDGELMRSRDGGASIATVGSLHGIVALAVDPARGGVVYAATTSGEIYRSADAGERWVPMSAGLPGVAIDEIVVGANGDRLYVATGAGVFEYAHDRRHLEAASKREVSIATFYGNFISAEGCGDGTLNANAVTAGPCETFTLFDLNGGELLDGDRIHLQAANGSFVVAEDVDGRLNANRLVAGAWETFTVHTGGEGRINLEASNGKFVAAENGGSSGCHCHSGLYADRTAAKEWETFTLIVR